MYPTTSDGRYFLACWYSDRTPEHGRLPRLSPFTCAFILRVLWLCGYSRKIESARTARVPTIKNAQKKNATH